MNNPLHKPITFTLGETPEERVADFTPNNFDEYHGQAALKNKLLTYAQAAKARNEPLDHILFFGPPGVGKTTLANVLAHSMQVHMKICSGPSINRPGDLVGILSSIEQRDVLFIDEIHRLSADIEEILYSAMDSFRIDLIVGQGAGARTMSVPLHPFTLIGATTKSGAISAPLRTRFGIIEKVDYYTDEELAEIVLAHATYLKVSLSPENALSIARCARGTPRIAKKIMRRIRDYAQVYNNNNATSSLIKNALSEMKIDEEGLTSTDLLLLKLLIEKYHGGPVGVETLAALAGEERETIEEVYEPFLIRKGLLERTPRGRQIPRGALPHLQKKLAGQTQLS
jgi:holliday junction DNA helicase RuvB